MSSSAALLQYAERTQSSNLQRPWSQHSKGQSSFGRSLCSTRAPRVDLTIATSHAGRQGQEYQTTHQQRLHPGLPLVERGKRAEMDVQGHDDGGSVKGSATATQFLLYAGSSRFAKRERAAEEGSAEKPKVRELIKQKRAKFKTADPAESEHQYSSCHQKCMMQQTVPVFSGRAQHAMG